MPGHSVQQMRDRRWVSNARVADRVWVLAPYYMATPGSFSREPGPRIAPAVHWARQLSVLSDCESGFCPRVLNRYDSGRCIKMRDAVDADAPAPFARKFRS